ncbi:MAG: penicillin-binding protein A [Oscillospiraceae bacterium]|nr:penicillin-binding protein A [Oscillospiraceae bacterium]
MKVPHPLHRRLWALVAFLLAALLLLCAVLYHSQIIQGSEFRALSLASNATSEEVDASRGIVTDRNGKVLISNRLTYTLIFSQDGFAGNADLNAAIWRLVELCRENDLTWTDQLPLTQSLPVSLKMGPWDESFVLFAQSEDLPGAYNDPFELELTAQQLFDKLRELYGLNEDYSDEQARIIAGIRYMLAVHDILGTKYIFAKDVSVELISEIVDGRYAGVETGASSTRVYNTPYAAHILGRIGPIYHEEWVGDEDNGVIGYRDQGYSMNALVGKDGVEKAFEQYLHGTDGTKLVTTNSEGKVTGEIYVVEPQPGGTVTLTLDIDLQAATEESLAAVIGGMEWDGIPRGGAAVCMAVGSGEVLSMASYPTYDLSRFDELYDSLIADTESAPLFNRATDGTYAPGSTFKPLTAVAALQSGVITPDSTIRDRGIYTYYATHQPSCWIYTSYGGTHGTINVTEALTVSCNYFFYEVGRLMGIETLSSYAAQFGFGRHTGIEIGDNAGMLASPESAEAAGLEWTDGQTLTASIGQSYHLFTPLQLANYMATLAGGGEHYEAHLLKNVKSYDSSQVLYAYNKEPLNTVEISDSTLSAVLEGMHDLTIGSLYYEFSDCVVSAGAKTGTAEIGNDMVNGVFIAFAPYENPQIAVAVAIEKAGAGAELAPVAVDIINAYFSRSTDSTAPIIGENTLIQ